MNTTASPIESTARPAHPYTDRYNQRVAFLNGLLERRPDDGQRSAAYIELDIAPAFRYRFRIFRNPARGRRGEWTIVRHAGTESKVMNDIGIRFELHGEPEVGMRFGTRGQAVSWIATHYEYEVERAMAFEAAR